MEKNFANTDKDVCKKTICTAERSLLSQMQIYHFYNVAPAGAILHNLMKSVRAFVKHFDVFLTGKTLEAAEISIFYYQHVAQFAGFIRDARPWFSQMEELFIDMENQYFRRVESGEHIEPPFLRPAMQYSEL